MAMSNYLDYNAPKILVIIFFFLLQANIYYFLLTSGNLAEETKSFSQSLQVRCQGNLLRCHTTLSNPFLKHSPPRASCPGTVFSCNSIFRHGWGASNGGDSKTCASICALYLWSCLWAALRRSWLFAASLQIFTLMISSLSFLFSRLNSPNSMHTHWFHILLKRKDSFHSCLLYPRVSILTPDTVP